MKEKASFNRKKISKTFEQMQATWESEFEKLHDQESQLYQASMEVREKMKKDLIQEASEWTKNLDPADCYADKLSGGNPFEMKKVCTNTVEYGNAPDLKKFINCLNRDHFCEVCCGYYIGPTNEKDLIKCESRCAAKVKGDANAYLVQYGSGRKKKGF